MTEPILIPCEGSGAVGNRGMVPGTRSCQMCGGHFFAKSIPQHDRWDILAMIERGDFG